MGRLAVVSDLHVDINQLVTEDLEQLAQILQDNNVSRIHFAGDTANKIKPALAVFDFFQRYGWSTTFNWGNHEMADLTEATIETFDDQRFLNFRTVPLTQDLVLLGVNGWYDYGYSTILDQKKIRRMKNLYWYDRKIQRSASDPDINQGLLQQLHSCLSKLTQQEKEVILVTHFVPRREFIVYQTNPAYERWNELNAFLGSEAVGDLIDHFPNVRQVIFGHTHRRFTDKSINGVQYSCRPFGYFYEWQMTRRFMQEYQLTEVLNPLKFRGFIHLNRPLFDEYKEKHLPEEFQQAITYIEY